jgi:hypothetical protein
MRDLTDDPTWEDDLSELGPEEGDPANGEEVSVIGDKLSNRTRYLYQAIDAGTANLVRTQWRPRPLLNCAIVPFFDAWLGDEDDYLFDAVKGSGAGPYAFSAELDLANGHELNLVRVYGYNLPITGLTVTAWKLDFVVLDDHGGDIGELPTATRLGTQTTKTTISAGPMGLFSVAIGGTEIVDRTRYRYVVQVYGLDGEDDARWMLTRVSTAGTFFDKGAG